MTVAETTTATEVRVAVNPEGIPDYLKARDQWVCWRLEERDGKLTKVPYNPYYNSKRRASTTNLMTWVIFPIALEAYEAGEYDGIGFVFCSADPFIGVDIDKCRDPETGEVEEWALKVIDRFDGGHAEVSPSGTGIHIITRGRLKAGGRRGRVEMYGQHRFFAVTGVMP